MATTLYPGIPFSPQAALTDNIGAADTIIEVSDASAFPPAPNLATIGTDEGGETILYTAKTETALSGCRRGVEGTARAWTAGELIGRNFTAKDHSDLIAALSETRSAAASAADAATEAVEAAKDAQGAARAAQEAAGAAEGKAAKAAETAGEALQDAQQARKDAQTAADAAATAQGAAETAQEEASAAREAAERALPITGGTITGDVTIGGSSPSLTLGDGSGYPGLQFESLAKEGLRLQADSHGVRLFATTKTADIDSAGLFSRLAGIDTPVQQFDAANKKYVDERADAVQTAVNAKAPKESPVFTGSVSLGRTPGTGDGDASFAVGYSVVAEGSYSHAEGCGSVARGDSSHAEGYFTFCDCTYGGHAEGNGAIAAPTEIYFKMKSYSGRVLSVDTEHVSFKSSRLAKITAGMKIYLWNDYYANKRAVVYEIASIDTTSATITLRNDLPASNYEVRHAVVPEIRNTKKYYPGHAEGLSACALESYSHAEGNGAYALGVSSHAEGNGTKASGANSHAEGNGSAASGSNSHAEGSGSAASGSNSHAEGSGSVASGNYGSHAEGNKTEASGGDAHAEGDGTKAMGENSHAGGSYTIARAKNQTAIGAYNVEYTGQEHTFIIGKGSSNTARANCFRVTHTGTYGAGSYNASGADYAELFEWADGNPGGTDRVGRFVTLQGDKLRLAGPDDDFVLGIISGSPSVVGDVHDDQWQGMYLYDVYGRPLWEDVEIPAETAEEPDPENPEKTVSRVIHPAHMERRQKLNPDYDGSQEYRPRTERPEWDAVGMLGKLVALDDGTCQVDGWCAAGEGGIATRSENKTRYRVMARLDERHIRVLVLA